MDVPRLTLLTPDGEFEAIEIKRGGFGVIATFEGELPDPTPGPFEVVYEGETYEMKAEEWIYTYDPNAPDQAIAHFPPPEESN